MQNHTKGYINGFCTAVMGSMIYQDILGRDAYANSIKENWQEWSSPSSLFMYAVLFIISLWASYTKKKDMTFITTINISKEKK